MEHVVFFPAPDGTPAFRRVASLEDAVRLVEHLRNVEGVHEVSVHPIGAEVPLAFRTWYRVEVPAAAPVEEPVVEAVAAPVLAPVEPQHVPAEEPVAEAPAEPVAEVPAQPVAESAPEGEPVAAAANGNGHRDVASLGFFAT